jgi:hypothetical protein
MKQAVATPVSDRPHPKKSIAALPCAARTGALLGTMLVDMRGAIQACSDAIADLAQWIPAEVLGLPVRALLPALPLQPGTAGYNLAYASFHSHSGRALTMRIAARGGTAIAVQARMRVMRNEREFQFLLELESMETHQA